MDDILLDSSGDIFISQNDLVIGDGDDQNVLDIIQSEKGEYKRAPQIGVGAGNFTASNYDPQYIRSQVRLNLELDVFKVNDVIVDNVAERIQITPICGR